MLQSMNIQKVDRLKGIGVYSSSVNKIRPIGVHACKTHVNYIVKDMKPILEYDFNHTMVYLKPSRFSDSGAFEEIIH